jgi:fructose-1,6-bisphosphatase I
MNNTIREASLVTLQTHMLEHASDESGGDDTLCWIMSALSISAKAIAAKLKHARLSDVLGDAGNENVQGEQQQKLDIIANDIMKTVLSGRPGVAVIGSEEDDDLIFSELGKTGSNYSVFFDPLDGSSNLDVAGGVGTIFSVFKIEEDDVSRLQPGSAQVAAGYVLYGSSTILVMTCGNGVHMFVLDTMVGAFIRVAENLKIPERGKTYSINEANYLSFPDGYKAYLDACHEQGYSSRYAGAMVADVHRILLKGGVFMYPPTAKAPNGKLRLMYECNPMTMVIVQAGGLGQTGSGDVLDVEPRELHQRVPIVLGSPGNVADVLARL